MKKTEKAEKELRKVKPENQSIAYGTYVTYNIYSEKWYAFSRHQSSAYWNGEECTYGIGDTAELALEDYCNKAQTPSIENGIA
jgi:hypothetical protein